MSPKSRPARAEPASPSPIVRRHSTPWLWLLPIITVLPYLCSVLHYSLPDPQPPT